MRCSKVRDILMDYVAEELPDNISTQVREHLAECQRCRTELEIARRASGALILLGHHEEPQGIIHVPSDEVKSGAPWQSRMRLQLLGALILIMVICIVGIVVMHTFKRTPTAVKVEQPAHTGGKSTAQAIPHMSDPLSDAVHAAKVPRASVRVPSSRTRRQIEPRTACNISSQTNHSKKPTAAGSSVEYMSGIIEISPRILLPVDELPEGAMIMVSVIWPSGSEASDDSYSYQYTEYDPETGASIECQGTRRGDSVELRLHGKPGVELAKGELDNETTIETDRNLLVCFACSTDTHRRGDQPY